MNVTDLLHPMPALQQALRDNAASTMGESMGANVDPAAALQAAQELMQKSLEDSGFPKDALARLENLSEHDNSDVWDAYVSQMASQNDGSGESVQDLDATIRELSESPNGNTEELDAYVAKLAEDQPVQGGLGGLLGTQLLNHVNNQYLQLMESIFEQQHDTVVDAVSKISATDDGATLASLNQDLRDHFDLPEDGDAGVEVALAESGGNVDIVEVEVATADAGDVIEADIDDDIIDANGEHYDGAYDDPYNDAIA